MKIAVYCGWRSNDSATLRLAQEVGWEIGRSGHHLVYGGGAEGAMGATMRAFREVSTEMTVVTLPEWVEDTDREPGKHLITVSNMAERKTHLEAAADGFLVLPGGLGTLEELFSVWSEVQNGLHSKPFCLVDPTGYYEGLLYWVRESQHITPAAQNLPQVARSAAGAVRVLMLLTAETGARAVY